MFRATLSSTVLCLNVGCFSPDANSDGDTGTGSETASQGTVGSTASTTGSGSSATGPTASADTTGVTMSTATATDTTDTTDTTESSESTGVRPACGDGTVVGTELCLVPGSEIPLGPLATIGQLAVADLDADTHLDVAAAFGAPDIFAFLGEGDGTFSAPLLTPIPNAYSLAIADINGGSLDLLAADVFGNEVLRATGIGDGTFGAPAPTATGANTFPWGIAAADIDNDTDIDVLAALSGSAQVGVLRNNGAGGFLGTDVYDIDPGSAPQFVEVGHLDGDGIPDAVVGYAGPLSVMLGTGIDGGLALDGTVPAGFTFEHRLADVNGDDELDLLYSLNEGQAVGVRAGDGDGTFSGETTLATGNGPRSLVIADVDQDLNVDVVVGNSGSNTVSVLRGDGTGNFGAQEPFDTTVSPSAVAVADFNEDGAMDIAWMGGVAGGSVFGVFLSDP